MSQELDLQYQPLAEPLTDGPFLPAWQPQVVDQVPRGKVGLGAALLATAICTFVPAPSALEAAARATYPDQIHRPAVHASRQQALAYHPEPIAPAAPAPELSWAPAYPDFTRARPGLLTARQQAWAGPIEPPADPFQIPALSWRPEYPDRIVRVQPHPSALPAWTGQAAVAGDQLSSGAADSGVIWRPARVQYQGLAAPVLVPEAVEPLTWAPDYPDQLLPARRVANWYWAGPLQPRGDGDLRWAPSFPDRVLPKAGLAAARQQAYTGPIEPPAQTDDLRWLAVYPDRVPGLRRPTGLLDAHTEPLAPILPVVALSWQGRYPDQIARVVLPTAAQQTLAFYPTPIVVVAAPDLSWAPEYPDQITRLRLLTAQQQAYAANLDPLSAAALVPLSWEPHYPSRPATAHLQWFASLVQVTAVPPPDAEVVVQMAAWRPVYPHRFPARVWLVPSGLVAPILDTAVIADDTVCVHLCLQDGTQARIRGLRVTQAVLVVPEPTHEGRGFEVC